MPTWSGPRRYEAGRGWRSPPASPRSRFLALTFNDYDALDMSGIPLLWPQAALTAFSAYAVGNIAGFGPAERGARSATTLFAAQAQAGDRQGHRLRRAGLRSQARAITSLALLAVAEDAPGRRDHGSPTVLRLIARRPPAPIMLVFWLGRGGGACISAVRLALPSHLWRCASFW